MCCLVCLRMCVSLCVFSRSNRLVTWCVCPTMRTCRQTWCCCPPVTLMGCATWRQQTWTGRQTSRSSSATHQQQALTAQVCWGAAGSGSDSVFGPGAGGRPGRDVLLNGWGRGREGWLLMGVGTAVTPGHEFIVVNCKPTSFFGRVQCRWWVAQRHAAILLSH